MCRQVHTFAGKEGDDRLDPRPDPTEAVSLSSASHMGADGSLVATGSIHPAARRRRPAKTFQAGAQKIMPPATSIVLPVMQSASVETAKATAAAMSLGSPIFPNGVFSTR